MTYLFVSHDLQVVRLLCDYVIVMKDGQIVEQGPTDIVMTSPADPYTRELLSTAPKAPVA
jgi:peptide/nickel transport system ATP-binding protein